MRRIDGIVGNRHDDPELDECLRAHEAAGRLERVVLEAAERKKSRLRVTTDAGTDLGVLVDTPELRAGDVLFVEEDGAAVVEFESRTAYVIELPAPSVETVAAAVELGHRVGNQHWDIAVDGGTVYVPLEVDRHILEDVIGEYVPEDARTRYEEVDASRFLEDGSGVDEHGHSHDSDEPGHGRGHGHSHDHE